MSLNRATLPCRSQSDHQLEEQCPATGFALHGAMGLEPSDLSSAAASFSDGSVSNLILASLLATVEAIFNLGTLGRNDTSATPMSDLFSAESLRTSLSSKVSTCQNC
jgi:hypothetical protein